MNLFIIRTSSRIIASLPVEYIYTSKSHRIENHNTCLLQKENRKIFVNLDSEGYCICSGAMYCRLTMTGKPHRTPPCITEIPPSAPTRLRIGK